MEKQVYENITSLLTNECETQRTGKLKKKRKDCLSILAVTLSVLTLLLLVITTAMVWKRLQSSELNTETNLTKKDSFACIPCIKLLLDPTGKVQDDPLLKQLSIQGHDGKELCCAATARQIAVLFESVARLNAIPDQPLASFNLSEFQFSPVSAHKRIYPARVLRGEFGIPTIPDTPLLCEFKEDDERYGLEHHRGVNITKHGIEILHRGLYYVYISIHFRPQSLVPCRKFRVQKFSAYVEKVAQMRHASEKLMQVSTTCCDSCINTQDVRFIGGMFILQRGDVIRVKVDSFELVQFSIYTSFAGLSMLGNSIPQSSERIERPE